MQLLNFATNTMRWPFRAVQHLTTFYNQTLKLSGSPLTANQCHCVKQVLRAYFNCNPPLPARPSASGWDINVILQFMKDLGSNHTLDPWKLAAKCLILTMLTTMCSLHEAVDIKISQMFPSVGGMRIMLNKPTKTFNMSTSRSAPGLQMLDLSRFENDELLCPVFYTGCLP